MRFYKIKAQAAVGNHGDGIYLMHTKWDDWFTFQVEYMCWYYLDSKKGDLGGIKIGAFSQGDAPFVEIPNEFDQLDADFFSPGTDESFYSNLGAPDLSEHREQILNGLNDIAFNEGRFKKALSTNVFKTALSRDISISSITGRFRRLAMGDAELTDHRFVFSFKNEAGQKVRMDFLADYSSAVPTNIHALIGRNGVGKSYILNEMVGSLVKEDGRFSFKDDSSNKFTSLLYVNLSSFEHKENYPENRDPKKGIVFQKLTAQTFR
ncbi:hypothetical protein [Lacticaseibacillus paracasei]|uniref:hypothetical protein n=1 Tax=Lacticaseibacillus paracasei TaxID=1597 RepID=UPI0036D3089F